VYTKLLQLIKMENFLILSILWIIYLSSNVTNYVFGYTQIPIHQNENNELISEQWINLTYISFMSMLFGILLSYIIFSISFCIFHSTLVYYRAYFNGKYTIKAFFSFSFYSRFCRLELNNYRVFSSSPTTELIS
jgi:hypothetical protein